MIGRRIGVVLGVALSASLAATTAWAQAEGERIMLTTSDDLQIAADWFAQPGPVGAPTVLLIHNQGSTRFGWRPLLPHLQNAGFQILVLDLRGHGDSKDTTAEVYARMKRRENEPYFEMIHDVEAGVRWLVEEAKVPADRIALIGGAHGANLAIQAGAENHDLAAVVAISPSQHFFGFPLVEYAKKFGNRPLFVIITKQYLSHGATEIQEIHKDNDKFEMKVFPRYELHGTQLLNLSWNVEGRIIKWLKEVMEIESS